MKTLGRHLLIELYGALPDALDDVARVRQALLDTALAIGAAPVGESFHTFAPQGVSGTLVIAESHLSIHTWPEHGYASVDVYTCGGLQPREGVETLRAALQASEVRVEEIVRGLPDELDAHRATLASPAGGPGPLTRRDVRVLTHTVDEVPVDAPAEGTGPGAVGLQAGGRWFVEGTVPGRRLGNITHGFRIERLVCERKTPFQELLIFDSSVYGRVMVLDGIVQLSTSDEHIYHELLVHPAMLAHPSPRRVLIVGGGDGGTLREVLRHDPEQVVMIDIDREVVELSERHLPTLSAGAFRDPRVTLLHADASKVVSDYVDHFDVAIIDGNDEMGVSAPLFGEAFHGQVARALRPDGVCAVQGGSLLDPELLATTRANLAAHLPMVVTRQLTMPSYHCGEYGFFVATRRGDAAGPPREVLARRLAERGFAATLRHYSPERHHWQVYSGERPATGLEADGGAL